MNFHWSMAILPALMLCWVAVRLAQRRLGARQRITAARVRSGYVPFEIPSVREDPDDSPETVPETPGRHRHDRLAVDEQPRIQIRYLDVTGKMKDRSIQVEHLDVKKRSILTRADAMNEARVIPLEVIREARNVETGRRFDIELWVKAVQVARHRRASLRNDFDESQFI